MKRLQLCNLLHAYMHTTPEEHQFKSDTLAFIAANPDCFERSLAIGHITASCWLVNKNNDRALLTHHATLNRWFQLGGHCDGDSDVLAVAIKEAQEESGITHIVPVSTEIYDIDVHKIPENNREKEHYHYDIRFLLKVTSDETVLVNHESKELRWISKDRALLPTSSQSVVRMFDKWVARS